MVDTPSRRQQTYDRLAILVGVAFSAAACLSLMVVDGLSIWWGATPAGYEQIAGDLLLTIGLGLLQLSFGLGRGLADRLFNGRWTRLRDWATFANFLQITVTSVLVGIGLAIWNRI